MAIVPKQGGAKYIVSLDFLFAARVNRAPMNLQRFEPSPRRIVARWAFIPCGAAYICHFGFFVFSDGTVEFFDLFGHQLASNRNHPDAWDGEFWFRELWDEWQRGEPAEMACRFSRTIRLPRRLIMAIQRLNDRGFTSPLGSNWTDALSLALSIDLENIFWEQLAKHLPIAPLKRESPGMPDRPFPTSDTDVVHQVPCDKSAQVCSTSLLSLENGAPLVHEI